MMLPAHRQAQRYLERRVDGPLPAAKEAWLQDHLQACAACRDYARQTAQFHNRLAQELPALWPHPTATRARLEQVAARAARQTGAGRWLSGPTRFAAQVAMVLLLATAAFWYFDRQGAALSDRLAPETMAFVDPAFPNAEVAQEALAVRFDLDFNRLPGGEIEFYVPVCDGVEYVPSAGDLFRKLNLGEPLPQCNLRAGDTVLLAPGAVQQVLLVYRNPSASGVRFRMEPTSRTTLSQPLAQALCAPAADGTCVTYDAPARGIWAKFITLQAPPGALPGAHINVTARVRWTAVAE